MGFTEDQEMVLWLGVAGASIAAIPPFTQYYKRDTVSTTQKNKVVAFRTSFMHTAIAITCSVAAMVLFGIAAVESVETSNYIDTDVENMVIVSMLVLSLGYIMAPFASYLHSYDVETQGEAIFESLSNEALLWMFRLVTMVGIVLGWSLYAIQMLDGRSDAVSYGMTFFILIAGASDIVRFNAMFKPDAFILPPLGTPMGGNFFMNMLAKTPNAVRLLVKHFVWSGPLLMVAIMQAVYMTVA